MVVVVGTGGCNAGMYGVKVSSTTHWEALYVLTFFSVRRPVVCSDLYSNLIVTH